MSSTNELNATEPSSVAQVKVWDPLVRVFHWSLVTLFAVAFLASDEWGRLHELAGYGVAGLIVIRLVWGLIGPKHARFLDFIYRPSTVISHVKDSALRRAERYLGHNPAGGAMVMVLLLMLGVITITGIMMTSDTFWGVGWVEALHKTAVNVTLGLIVLHMLGVVLASVEHGENLVRAMITGRKRAQ